jgi:RND family efflux transporter MFP subunit
MKRRIPVLPLLAIVTAVLAAVSIARTQPRQERAAPPLPPPRAGFAKTVAAVGLIESNSENIEIGTERSGVVSDVHVRAGDGVKRGDPLFELDVRHLRADLAEAETAIEVARAGVAVAESALADVRQQLALVLAVTDSRATSKEEIERRRHAVETADARLAQARANVAAAEARRDRAEVEIERSIVRAPIDGRVLRVDIRAGEYAAAGPAAEPLVVVGDVDPLFVRVDVDEQEASRVKPDARASAALRGNADIRSPLRFVRFEPLVVPKRSLTGDAAERVDTRVLQVIYEIERHDPRFVVGQQMDVFIEAGGRS